MRTECKQATFEFHGLFQPRVKARFDGGKITSDAGALLLREVERQTGLIAGLTECFSDHRDPRLIEHTVKELLGQRIYGLCLGYEELNDHDRLRTDPMLAVAVNKADPLGETRRQASDRGMALAGKCTLNRLELTGAEVDQQERYKKIAMDPDQIDGWMVDAFLEAHESAPEEIVLDLDAPDAPIHGQQEGRFFHMATTATTVISRCTSSRGSICCALGCGVPISMGPRDRPNPGSESISRRLTSISRRTGAVDRTSPLTISVSWSSGVATLSKCAPLLATRMARLWMSDSLPSNVQCDVDALRTSIPELSTYKVHRMPASEHDPTAQRQFLIHCHGCGGFHRPQDRTGVSSVPEAGACVPIPVKGRERPEACVRSTNRTIGRNAV